MNGFVDRIDELLRLKKLTRKDLAKSLNIPHNCIAQWKLRGSIPNALTAVKIAKFLNTSVEYLVTGEASSVDSSEIDVLKDKLSRIEKLLQNIRDVYGE